MRDPISRRARRSSSRLSALAAVLALALILTACGGGDDEGAQIEWNPGTPPGLAAVEPTPQEPSEDAPSDGTPPPPDIASADERPADPLTPEQRVEWQPNELGKIPILEYHSFTTDPDKEDQYTRTIADFRADLAWLNEHDFYVVPLRDVVLNRIDAPAGKHPVALTFDDSTVGQFRYLINDDGSVDIDPDSAVGIMEAFYAEHPDFGRGGWFATIPNMCFDWQTDAAEPDQTPYCEQKIRFLIEHGYEIGNHTLNHKGLEEVDDETFEKEIGGAIEALQEIDPSIDANIFSLPYGIYPGFSENERQMDMLVNGFQYEGRDVQLIGVLLVGAEPTVSPVSTDWDWAAIQRIQVFDDADVWGSSAFWFEAFENDPSMLYVSDGNPDTITISTTQPPALDGTFDPAKADGKDVIEYDPETGEVV